MRTGASWAETFFFFLTKDEKTRLYLNRFKPFEVAQKKTTLWANKSFSLLSNRFFLAWVTNVSARVNARTLEREQKIKRKIEEGGGDRRKPSFSPPPLPAQFFCSRNRFAERLATLARFFLVRVPVHWRTDGHKWGHCILVDSCRVSFEYAKIDLVTVFDAILTSRQTCEKLECLYENLMSNNFRKTAVLKKMWFVN